MSCGQDTPNRINLGDAIMKIKLALVAIALVASTLISSRVSAVPDSWTFVTYYSDSSKTVEVGTMFTSCNGHRNVDGTRTLYMSIESGTCYPPTCTEAMTCWHNY